MIPLLLTIFGICGLLISTYIFYKKRRQEEMLCFLGGDCNDVVNSKYATMFIVPNEVLGIGYYILIFVYAILLKSGAGFNIFIFDLRLAIAAVALVAAGYSVYLTYIQLFVLKKTCEYCMTVNLINILILALIVV